FLFNIRMFLDLFYHMIFRYPYLVTFTSTHIFENTIIEIRSDFFIKYTFKQVLLRFSESQHKAFIFFFQESANSFFIHGFVTYSQSTVYRNNMEIDEYQFT